MRTKSSLLTLRGRANWGLAALVACLAAGCSTATPVPSSAEGVVSGRTTSSLINEGGPVFGLPTDGGNLINEGGPVFGKPPTQFQIDALAVAPKYYTGDLSALYISSERLDGVGYPDVVASKAKANGSFTLQGPATAKYFFTSATFQFEDTSHSLRALAKADSHSELKLDMASTLVAAKIASAGQRRHLYTVDYDETMELTALVRARLGDRLDRLRLDAANDDLSAALSALATQDEGLSQRLKRWEFTLDPSLAATPAPLETSTPAPQAPGVASTVPPSAATGK